MFGGVRANPRKSSPRAGVRVGRRKLRALRELAAMTEALPDIAPKFEGDALAFFQSVYADPKLPLETRIIAAARAVQFEKPALAATHISTSVTKTLEQLLAEKAALASERGISLTTRPATIEGVVVGEAVGSAPE
jgi:hypothetical protein